MKTPESNACPLASGTKVAFIGLSFLLTASCRGTESADVAGAAPADVQPSEVARTTVTALRERPGTPLASGVADSFQKAEGVLKPRFGAAARDISARVSFPSGAAGAVRIEDAASGARADVALGNSVDVAAQVGDGYVVYPRAHESGATVLHRALPDGFEDFISFDERPRTPEVVYQLTLAKGISGLRLVEGTLELLNDAGTPRLRATPPFVVDAEGTRTDAVFAVEGCAVDRSPAPPWGRRVTPPGAGICTVHVSWKDDAVAYPAVLDPRWTTTGQMQTERYEHTATLLSNGKVLVTGGRSSTLVTAALPTAELFNPADGTWSPTASLSGARRLHTATQLPTSGNANTSGKVLVAGGISGTLSVNTARLYDPVAGTWMDVATIMVPARHMHTATLLASGQVLIAGGMTNNGVTSGNPAVRYNPATNTGTWTNVGSGLSPRRAHTATLLVVPGNAALNNKVLFVGGNSGSSDMSLDVDTVQLFDGTSNWTTPAALALTTFREGHTATALANGSVLITGGRNGTDANTLDSAILFNVTGSGSWSPAGTMTSKRQGHTATLPPAGIAADGQVLVIGGSSNGTDALPTAELWNGTTGWTTTTTAPPGGNVRGHTATVLANGAVLIAGGRNSTPALKTATLYDPSYGLGCTSGSQCASGFCANGVCCDSACTDQCTACNLVGSVGTCTAKTNGTACNDANACTLNDTCQTGACTSGAAVTCAAQSQCHLAGTCDPATGACSQTVKPNGTTCNDSLACTQSETCVAGACTDTNDFPTIVNLPVTDMGSLGLVQSFAEDINSSGVAVGWSSTVPSHNHAWLYSGTGPMVDLAAQFSLGSPSSARAINDSNTVVGFYTVGGVSRAFRYGASGVPEDIDTIGDGSLIYNAERVLHAGDFVGGSFPTDINNAGDVVGFYTLGGKFRGFRALNGEVPKDVTTLEDGDTVFMAGISESGTAVGNATRAPGSSTYAVLYDNELVGLRDLNTFVDEEISGDWALITANAINGDYVVGLGIRDGDGVHRPYRLTLSKGAVDDISGGWLGAHAMSVNAAGDVVGTGLVDAEHAAIAWASAFVFTDQLGFKKLDDLIPQNYTWTLRDAQAINDAGEIVGWAYHNGYQGPRPFKMRLPPGQAATCQARGVCGGGATICLYSDGYVEKPGGGFAAVFGYDNSASTNVTPTQNEVWLGGSQLPNPRPAPPALLSPGTHPGAYMPTFAAGQTVSWKVNGQTVDSSGPRLDLVGGPGGVLGVVIAGTFIPLPPDDSPVGALAPIAEGFATVGSTTYAIFSYTNSASRNINAPYGAAQNVLTNASGIITNPAPIPPSWFLPGTHRGVIAYPLNGHLTWTLGTQSATVCSPSTQLPYCSTSTQLPVTTQAEGPGVTINETFVVLIPNPSNNLQGSIVATEETNLGGPLPASFAVGPDGAATVNVPIWVPPGRAGMQPALALSYDSQHTTRWDGMGPGWRLQGLSQITRCSKNLARDGVIAEADLFGDTFCLDGDMMIRQGEGAVDGAIYRTEHDRFAKIVRTETPPRPGFGTTPEAFTVYLRDGRVAYYDAAVAGPQTFETLGSSSSLPTTHNSGDLAFPYAWSLSSISDRSGNVIEFSYNTTVHNNRDPFLSSGDEPCVEQHIDSITYGGHKITFQYTPAVGSDNVLRRRMFVDGFCMETTVKMTGIQILGRRPETGSTAPQLLKQYELAVQAPGLSSVTEKDSNGVSGTRTVRFTYENEAPLPPIPSLTPLPFTMAPLPLPPAMPDDTYTGFPGPRFATGDINGDSFDDIVYVTGNGLVAQLSNGDAAGLPVFGDPISFDFSPGGSCALQVIDADMDGKADVVFSELEPEEVHWVLRHTTYRRSVGYDAVANRLVTESRPYIPTTVGAPPLIADLQGDGLADMVVNVGSNGGFWSYRPLSVAPFSGQTAEFSAETSNLPWFGATVVTVAGRFASRQATSFLNATDATFGRLGVVTGYGQQLAAASRHGEVPYADKYVALDLNGDGLSDLASVDYRFGQRADILGVVVATTPTAFINTGLGFRARDLANYPGTAAPQARLSNKAPLGVLDLNKDGFDDLIILAKDPRVPIASAPVFGGVPGYVYLSTGNGLSLPLQTPVVSTGDQPYRVLDFNGDGRPDLLTMKYEITENGPTFTHKVYRNDQPRQLLKGMSGGLNDSPSVIEYDAVGRVARSAPGGANCTNNFPMHCPPTGPLVVTKVRRESRGLGESSTLETYTYSGPEMDLQGRGWLGVKNRRVVRTPVTNPNYILTVQDSHYGVDTAAMGTVGSRYDYPRARMLIGEITYYAGHGSGLDNTASAIGVGIAYSSAGSNNWPAYATIPTVFVTKKRTVLNFSNVLQNMSLAFDPIAWPPSGTDLLSSRRGMTIDPFGNPTREDTITNLSNGTQITQTVDTTYSNNEENWLIGRLTSRKVKETTPEGTATRKTVFTPDPVTGLLVHETYQSGIPDEQLDTEYVRNDHGLPIKVTQTIASGESRSTNVVYDDFDGTFAKQITNALGQSTDLTYHPGFGVLVATKDPNGQRTVRTYDGFARLRSATGPDGTGAQLHYENPELAAGNARLGSTEVYQIHAIADSGAEMKVVHDILNRETVRSTKDFTGTSWSWVNTSYDPNVGRPSRVTVPSAAPDDLAAPASTFTYDSMGRPTFITLPEGSAYTHTYGTDTSWSVVGPEGRKNSMTDDGTGRLISTSDFVLKPTDTGHDVGQSYRYGPFGVLVGIDVDNGPSTKIRYDASGRRIALDDPDTGHSTYTWNGFGELFQETDANHKVTTFVRDALGRVHHLLTADGVTTYEWDTAPNGIGQLAKTTSPDDVDCSYSYDGAGRLSSKTWTLRTGIAAANGTYTIGMSYDAAGRPSAVTYPAVAGQAPVVINQTYAPNGTLSGLVREAGSQTMWTVNTRNARGQITKETAGNNVITTYDYPAATGLLHNVTSKLGGQVLRELVYDYDGARRVKQRTTDTQAVEKFTYDTIDRLVDWQTGAATGSPHTEYTYDDLANLTLAQRTDGSLVTSTSFTPGDGVTKSRHQIASSSLGAYEYDARGDQVSAPGRTVAYNTFGLPKTITTGAGITSFAYDGAQSRVVKVSGDTVIVSLGGLFERRIQTGQPTNVFYAIGEGKPVAQISWTETGNSVVEDLRYLHDDHIQSVESATNAQGLIVARQRFEPFGGRISTAPAGIRVGYQGAEQDDDVALVNMNGRLYDPVQFRFITPDPLVTDPSFSQDLNRYAFVRNSPLNYRDPSGFSMVPQQADSEDPQSRSGCTSGYCSTINTGSGYASQEISYGYVGTPTPIDDGTPRASAGAADGNGTNGGLFGPSIGAGSPEGVPLGGGPSGPTQGGNGVAGVPNVGNVSADRVLAVLPPGHTGLGGTPPWPLPNEGTLHFYLRQLLGSWAWSVFPMGTVRMGVGAAVDLAASEAAGGHLLAEHVGKTGGQLLTRLNAQPWIPAASTFASVAEAEAAASAVLTANSAKLAPWLAGGAKGKLAIDAPFVGGQVLVRGSTAPVTGTGALMVLKGTGNGGWYILTGYPLP